MAALQAEEKGEKLNEVIDEVRVINEGSKKQELVRIFCGEELNPPYLCVT